MQASPNFLAKSTLATWEQHSQSPAIQPAQWTQVYGAVFFNNNPLWNWRIVHSLRVPYFSNGNMFVGYYRSLNACYETRHHPCISQKASNRFELLIGILTCFQHKKRQRISSFNQWKAFWAEFHFRNQYWIDTNDGNFFDVKLPYMKI